MAEAVLRRGAGPVSADDARRANQRKQGGGCPECGGGVWLGSGWLPHAKGCRRREYPTRPPVSFDVEGIPRSN